MKNYSLNDDYIKNTFMIKKELNEKLKLKRFQEKTTIKNLIENILKKNL